MLYIAQNNVYSRGVYLNLHLVTQINVFHSKYW